MGGRSWFGTGSGGLSFEFGSEGNALARGGLTADSFQAGTTLVGNTLHMVGRGTGTGLFFNGTDGQDGKQAGEIADLMAGTGGGYAKLSFDDNNDHNDDVIVVEGQGIGTLGTLDITRDETEGGQGETIEDFLNTAIETRGFTLAGADADLTLSQVLAPLLIPANSPPIQTPTSVTVTRSEWEELLQNLFNSTTTTTTTTVGG